MSGMLQIITYLLSFYLVIKGIEVLQIGLASGRQKRGGLIIIGLFTVLACLGAAAVFCLLQDEQAVSIGRSMPH